MTDKFNDDDLDNDQLDSTDSDLEEWGKSLQDTIDNPDDNPDDLADNKSQDENEDEDQKAYSKRVNKRIGKLKHESYLDRAELTRQRDENAQLKARLDKLETDHHESILNATNQSTDSKIKTLEDLKITALQELDFNEVVKLDKQLFQLMLKSRPSETSQATPPPEPQKPAPQQTEAVDDRPFAMQDWETKNGWINDTKNTTRVEKANAVLKTLLDNGYDIDDPETYDALDKKLQRIKPPPTGAPDRGRDVGVARDSSFSTADKTMMRDWGLNPENPRDRAEWLKNKVAV